MNPFTGRMTSHQSEGKRILTLLQNLRDLTLHCLQLVEQDELDELSFWLIRRRACMEEIDQIHEASGSGKGLAAVAALDDAASALGFTIERSNIEALGLCPACRTKQ